MNTPNGRETDASQPLVPMTDIEDDAGLLARVAAGDATALADLYDRYRTLSYSIALKVTRDATAAEDVVQEAFLGVWRNAGRFDASRASVRTWLLSITHHRAVDAVRRRRPTTELPDAEATAPPTMVVPDVWGEVAGRLDRDAIIGALGTLPAAQREAIELAYYGGLTQQEIATRTDTPLGTVKSRVRLGLLSLRRVLAEADGSAGADAQGAGRVATVPGAVEGAP
jgi:RNA polymerase sigma factor (sigma-70 family)